MASKAQGPSRKTLDQKRSKETKRVISKWPRGSWLLLPVKTRLQTTKQTSPSRWLEGIWKVFPESHQIFSENPKLGRIIPLLSDLLTTDETFRVTIENFLDGYMNHYVVETEAQAICSDQAPFRIPARGKSQFLCLAHFEEIQISQSQLFPNGHCRHGIIEYDVKVFPSWFNFNSGQWSTISSLAELPDFRPTTDAIFTRKNGKYLPSVNSPFREVRWVFSKESESVEPKTSRSWTRKSKELSKKVSSTRNNLDRSFRDLMKLRRKKLRRSSRDLANRINETEFKKLCSIRTKKWNSLPSCFPATATSERISSTAFFLE